MYRILPLADDFVELCDECGFNGALVDMKNAAARLRDLGEDWSTVFSLPEELVRARPAAETWCPVEYAQHTAFALGAIEWAARQFVRGLSPDWNDEPQDLAGKFEHDVHDCHQFALRPTLNILMSAASSMADLATSLTPQEQARRADYGGGLIINTAAVVRHALHDAEHHLLDIRRGTARLQLPSSP